ncbi:MAG: hypothetical protein ACKPKB_01415, partial [Dolichospermum sp.]
NTIFYLFLTPELLLVGGETMVSTNNDIRIVSLIPSATEIIAKLGLFDNCFYNLTWFMLSAISQL